MQSFNDSFDSIDKLIALRKKKVTLSSSVGSREGAFLARRGSASPVGGWKEKGNGDLLGWEDTGRRDYIGTDEHEIWFSGRGSVLSAPYEAANDGVILVTNKKLYLISELDTLIHEIELDDIDNVGSFTDFTNIFEVTTPDFTDYVTVQPAFADVFRTVIPEAVDIENRGLLVQHAATMEMGYEVQVLLGIAKPKKEADRKKMREGGVEEEKRLERVSEENDKLTRMCYLYKIDGLYSISDLYASEAAQHAKRSGALVADLGSLPDWRIKVTELLEHISFLVKTPSANSVLLECYDQLIHILSPVLNTISNHQLKQSTSRLLQHCQRQVVSLSAASVKKTYFSNV